MNMVGALDGRVAVVTGAGSGIGRATAALMARRGAAVIIADIVAANAQAVAEEITAEGGTARAVAVDVSSEDEVRAMIATALDTFGRLDILFNSAALLRAEHMARDTEVTELDVDVWDRTMAVNARGTMLCCKHALPTMLSVGGGSIVNTSSNAAGRGDMMHTAYAASKAAIVSLTYYVAAQYGRDGVRCNVIMPAAVGERQPNLDSQAADVARENSIMGRNGRPADVASAVAFLASDEAAWVTGAVIPVNGGFEVASYTWRLGRAAAEKRRARATPTAAPDTGDRL